MSGLDLFLDQSVLVRMLIVAMAAGVSAGVLFDLTAVLCLIFGFDPAKHSNEKRGVLPSIVRFVGDVLFSLAAAILFLLVCYYTSDGQVRSPAVFGAIIGFCAYRFTVGALIRRALFTSVRLIRRTIRAIMKAAVRLLGVVWRRLLCPYAIHPIIRLALWLWCQTAGRVLLGIRTKKTKRMAASLAKRARAGFELGEGEQATHIP